MKIINRTSYSGLFDLNRGTIVKPLDGYRRISRMVAGYLNVGVGSGSVLNAACARDYAVAGGGAATRPATSMAGRSSGRRSGLVEIAYGVAMIFVPGRFGRFAYYQPRLGEAMKLSALLTNRFQAGRSLFEVKAGWRSMASRSLNLLMAPRNASHLAVFQAKRQQQKFSADFPSLRPAYQSVG